MLDLELRGHGSDAEGRPLPDAALKWSVTGPDGVRRELGAGGTITPALEALAPFSTTYTIHLEVEDSRGRTAETFSTVTVENLA